MKLWLGKTPYDARIKELLINHNDFLFLCDGYRRAMSGNPILFAMYQALKKMDTYYGPDVQAKSALFEYERCFDGDNWPEEKDIDRF